jgi:PAS domain S-box-containing protein
MSTKEKNSHLIKRDDVASDTTAISLEKTTPESALIADLKQRIAELERENDAIRTRLETFQQTEKQLKRVLEGADEGFWDWDLVAQTFVVSERFETMLGLHPGERDFSPEKWADYVHPEDLPKAIESIRLHLGGITPSHTLEFRCRTKSGEWMYILTRGRVVNRDATGKPLMMSGTHTDISERKQAEAKLIEAMNLAETANRDKSRFLASASHDLRQPMQAMRLLVDSLGQTKLDEDQQRICRYIGESTQAICGQLNALLDISKLDSGAVKLNAEAVRVSSLIGKVDREYSALAIEKSLRFKLFFPFPDLAINTDSRLLMSLLGNLIDNAIKYTAQGGVLVAIRRRGAGALIQVWDTGSGIAAEHLENIFGEYFQIGNPERDRAKGLGLGLAISRRIARLLGTEVVCRSRPGRGSIFEFLLPLAVSQEEPVPSRTSHSSLKTSAKPVSCRIALIENDLMVGTAETLALESCSLRVTRYKTAEDALADSEVFNADFYIADLRLPGLSGIELLDALQRRTSKRIKAVVLTGDTAVSRIDEMRPTPWPVLFKPIDLDCLLAAIEAQNVSDF